MYRNKHHGDKRPRRWEHTPEPTPPPSVYDTLSDHSKERVDAMIEICENKKSVASFLKRMEKQKQANLPLDDEMKDIIEKVRRAYHNPPSLPERPTLEEFKAKAVYWKQVLVLINTID